MPTSILSTSKTELKLTPSTKPEDVIALLGAPTDAWDDDVEHCLEYSTPDLSLRLYWDVKTSFGIRRLKYKSVDMNFDKPLFQTKKEPNQSLQTTIMAVTDAAAQPPRQP
jgi:hypothetical protein